LYSAVFQGWRQAITNQHEAAEVATAVTNFYLDGLKSRTFHQFKSVITSLTHARAKEAVADAFRLRKIGYSLFSKLTESLAKTR
jgi:hypothetical protein